VEPPGGQLLRDPGVRLGHVLNEVHDPGLGLPDGALEAALQARGPRPSASAAEPRAPPLAPLGGVVLRLADPAVSTAPVPRRGRDSPALDAQALLAAPLVGLVHICAVRMGPF